MLMTKPFTKNHISSSQNELKLAYSTVQLQKFYGGNTPGPPLQGRGGERRDDRPRHFTMLAGLTTRQVICFITKYNGLEFHLLTPTDTISCGESGAMQAPHNFFLRMGFWRPSCGGRGRCPARPPSLRY
jgi:hypothetical protein